MPKIHAIGSIEIWVYFFDTQQHKAPHFHAVSRDGEAVVRIGNTDVLAGGLKGSQLKKVLDWAGSDEGKELLKASWNQCNPQQVIED